MQVRRRALLLALGFMSVQPLFEAEQATAQSLAVIRGGVVHYQFVDGIPATISCTPGMTCDLSFESGEEIQDIVCARSTHNLPQIGWAIDTGSQGKTPHIYLTPTPASPPANLIVTTNRRRYVAILVARESSHLYYTFDTKPRPVAQVTLSPTPAATATPQPTPTPRTIDRQFFSVRPGGPLVPFIPTGTWREGDLTIIDLPIGYYAKPSVLAWNPDTKLGTAVGWSYETEDSRLIVQGIFPHLLLFTGDLSNEQKSDRVYIDRADLPVAQPGRRRK